MVAEIDRIFSTEAKSVWRFMIENGQGYYIPAYQCPYSWNTENISRLFEDVLYGIRKIISRPDIISFIGTIISIHDTEYETVRPIYHNEVAPRVMTIIDGQQRICTIVMSNIVLHDYIRHTVKPFQRKTDPHLSWIDETCAQIQADLRNTYLIDRTYGDDNYRYYPRIIRAYSDVWSRRQDQAIYESSIAKLIWEYIDFTESGTTAGQFSFNPTDSDGTLINDHKAVYDAFKFIQREVKRICQLQPDLYDFPNLVSAMQNQESFKGIWDFSIPEEVKKYVVERSNDRDHKRFCQLLRALIFARYLNHNIAVTVVIARNEDDAFDMFEALNTTGEPLTAFETFRPKVIEFETLSEYEHSPSYQWMKEIDDYLNSSSKANKQQVASEMLVPFALFETGFKLQKKLNEQRRYLRDEFDKLSNINQKRIFVKSLANVASFFRHGWNVERGKDPNFAPLTVDDEEALVGFEVLRELKHSITIAPLARFYQDALDATQEEREKKIKDFIAAIKATVAFSVLWRGAMGGTRNIDSHYRDIMRIGVRFGGASIPPLARHPNDKFGVVSIANYKKALRLVLRDKGKIHTKEDWVNLASKIPIYSHSKPLTRFLVFCASDDTIPDETRKGLLKRGRQGINPLLTLNQWKDDAYFTVEHIAPQSYRMGWEEDIYNDSKIVDTLGNLILLPKEENSILGNRSWEHKKLMYSLLAAKTEDEFDNLKAKLGDVGLNLSKTANEVLQNSKYLGFCKSVAHYDENWSLDIIEKRSCCFAKLVWDRLENWLF